MRIPHLAPALLTGALLVSCGGGDGGGGAGSSTEFIASYCNYLSPCCAKAGLKSDGKQCRVLLGAFAPANYDATAGQACLAELQAASSKGDFCESDLDSASCNAAFPDGPMGTKKPGETCTEDDECASSTEGEVQCQSSFTGGSEVRKCQLQITGKAGDQPCVGTVTGTGTSYVGGASDLPARAYLCRVADGLYCDGKTQVCVKFKAMGEGCSGLDECGPTAFCDGTRKCAARKNPGETCSGGFTLEEECVDSAYCQEMSMSCVAKQGNGATCTEGTACKSSSCVNGKCEGDAPANFALTLICGN